MKEAKWTVSDLGIRQINETRTLFERVFGHAMSEALWRWKYDDGRGFAVGARAPTGELLAHYGGTLRKVLLMGHAVNAVQIGDVMVAHEGRAALAHKGPFGMVVTAFLNHIGVGSGPMLGFGFPSARHMKLGERLGHYAQVDQIFELKWHTRQQPDGKGAVQPAIRLQAIDWGDASAVGLLDKLWVTMQRDLHGLAVPARESAWWRHRYANHPEHTYSCFWVRSGLLKRVQGAIVLRGHPTTGAESEKATVWELMDWLAPLSKTSLMLSAAQQVAQAAGAESLMGWFSSSIRQQFANSDAVVHLACTTGVTIPTQGTSFPVCKEFSPTVAALAGKWWLTGGDTDFR